MGWIIFIIIVLVLAAKFDEKDGNTTCFVGLLSLIFGIGIIAIAFAVNPILGIIVLLVVINGWKKM